MTDGYQRLAITITLESPLALGERKPGGQATHVLDYLPGARLRGAVAEALLDEGADDLGALFDSPGAAIFRDARPAAVFRDAGQGTADAPADVLPATAMSCKRHPGFRGAPTRQAAPGERPHGVYDTLLDRAFLETLNPAGLLYRPRCAERSCEGWAAPFRGYYAAHGVGGAASYARADVSSRLLARVALDRRRRVAADELLYTVPVLGEFADDGEEPPRPTVFHGEVLVPDDANGARVAAALERVDHLGGGGSRGLGAVRITTAPAAAPDPLAARLDRFRGAVARRREQYARLAPLSARLAGRRLLQHRPARGRPAAPPGLGADDAAGRRAAAGGDGRRRSVADAGTRLRRAGLARRLAGGVGPAAADRAGGPARKLLPLPHRERRGLDGGAGGVGGDRRRRAHGRGLRRGARVRPLSPGAARACGLEAAGRRRGVRDE